MRWALLMLSILVCAPLPALGAGHDYPTLGHIKGYHIIAIPSDPSTLPRFEAAPGGKLQVQGHKIDIEYDADDNVNHGSSMEIYLNYHGGFEIVEGRNT